MRRPRLFACVPALLAIGCAWSVPAYANPGPEDLLRPRGLELGETRDAGILWGRGYSLLLRAGYAPTSIPVEGFAVSDRREEASARLRFAYGFLAGRMDASVALDVRGSRFLPAPAVGRSEPAETSFGDVGDTEIGLRVGLPAASKRLSASLEAFAVLPTGNADKGLSADAADGGLLLGATAQGGGAKIYLQAGYRVNRNEGEGVLLYPIFYPKLAPGEDDTDNDALMIRGALEVHSERVDLFVELLADRLMGSEAVRGRENFLEAAPGFRVRLRRGLYVSASAGFNLSEDDPATQSLASPEVLFPDWRLSVGVQWIGLIGGTDRDDDGIADGFDRCPDSREDYDGYRDEDGCPDADNDGDGVLDDWDKAPFDPEDQDGFEDADGAPDLDNDEDGLPDAEDFCPDDSEDPDGDRDDDGCPDEEPAPNGVPEQPQPGTGEKT